MLDAMRRRLLIAVAATAVLGGCASMKGVSLNPLNWFGRSPPPPPAPLATIANPVTVKLLWQASVGKAGRGYFVPAVVGGAVYAADGDGNVTRFDASTGKQVWRTATARTLLGGVGADADTVVVASSEGEIIALDNDGRERWRTRVSSEVLAAPVVDGDVVVVRSTDSRIFALDARDGKRRWVYQRSQPTLAVRSATGIVLQGGYAFSGFSGGKLVAVAANNGGLRWEGSVSLPKGTTEIERVTDVVGMPWIGDREACAVSYQGRVACFDLTKGQQLWARPISSSAGLGVDVRYVFISEDRGAVSALDRSSGNSLWRQDRLANRVLTAPLPLGREIAVGDIEGHVHLLARESGAFAGRVSTDGSQIAAPPVRLPDGFLVQTTKGGLFAFATPQ
jgi:outer membrane protein assembly factor BamB